MSGTLFIYCCPYYIPAIFAFHVGLLLESIEILLYDFFMRKTNFNEAICPDSIWNVSTPSEVALQMPFYVLEAGLFRAMPEYVVERSYHDSYLLLFTVEGEGIITVGGKSVTLPKGFAILFDCHTPHRYESNGTDWTFSWLHILGNSIDSLCNVLTDGKNLYPAPVTELKFQGIFLDLLNTFHIQTAPSLISSSVRILKLLELLSKEKEGDTPSFSPIDSSIEYIHANYSKPVSIDELSENANLSKYYFIKLFKRKTGLTPYAYLTNYRINEAKRLLVESDCSVEKISELSGFSDPSCFIAAFKKNAGLSPLKYRQSKL